MKIVNIYKYYKFDCFDYNIKTLPNQMRCNDLLDYVKSIKNNINELNLPRYKETINILLEQISKKIIDQKADDKIISTGLLEEVKEQIAKVNGLIEKGLRKIDAYIPAETKLSIGEIHKNQLLNLSVTRHFEFNIIEFCKCYTLCLFPSASIHIINATEEYNRYFNIILKKNELAKESNDNNILNFILTETKKLTFGNINEELIDSLYEIGNHYKKEIGFFNKILIKFKDKILSSLYKKQYEKNYDEIINDFEKLIHSLHQIDREESEESIKIKKSKALWDDLLINCEKYLKTWNEIICETKNLIPKNSNNTEMINSLYVIKNDYRNKITHYDKKMENDDEVVELYKVYEKVSNQMSKMLKTSKIH